MESEMKCETEAVEEGELIDDSDDGYTPLQRPVDLVNIQNALHDIEDSLSDSVESSDSSSESENALLNCRGNKKTKRKRKKSRSTSIKATPRNTDKDIEGKNMKKYNVWAASLQEDCLLEHMNGIGVVKNVRDRNVESYDYSQKYQDTRRGLKRRLSTSGGEYSDGSSYQTNKKLKSGPSKPRRSVKERLGRRESSSSCDSQNSPRYILDLIVNHESECDEIAKDIANKLCEKKDDLLIRIVEVLGKQIPIEVFKETQRIERDGGMLIMNGMRRRTPGGVFLFLIKHHDGVSAESKKLIFSDDCKKNIKDSKDRSSLKREKKVEELKKRLNLQQKELRPLAKRAEVFSRLHPDTHATISNPPPSPVNNTGQENSPEYGSHAINHVSDASPDKSTTKVAGFSGGLTTYDDDFLDLNYEDVDMF